MPSLPREQTWRRKLGRAGGDHQDPQTTLLLLAGRITRSAFRLTLHPPPALALGKPVQQRPGAIARHATSLLTRTLASHPSIKPLNCLTELHQVGPSVSPAAICPAALALRGNFRRSTSSGRGNRTPHHPILSASRARRPFPSPLIPGLTSTPSSLRWIRVWSSVGSTVTSSALHIW